MSKKYLKKRECVLCPRSYVPAVANQKYCGEKCRNIARKLRSIKRDSKEYAIVTGNRIDAILNP